MDNKIMTCFLLLLAFLLFATQNLYSLKKVIIIFLKIFHKVIQGFTSVYIII